ncbi:MAG: hypothetical protein R6X20_05295, partial [Phycisphaerae bacterium]
CRTIIRCMAAGIEIGNRKAERTATATTYGGLTQSLPAGGGAPSRKDGNDEKPVNNHGND